MDLARLRIRVMRLGWRGLSARGSLLMLVLIACGVLIFGQRNPQTFEALRVRVVAPILPVIQALAQPAQLAANIHRELSLLTQLREDNIALRAEVSRLRPLETQNAALAQQNAQLSALLNYQPPAGAAFITADVAAQAGGPHQRSLLALAGVAAGVVPDMAAVSGAGLVGRVTGAGFRTARVLLLTDPGSRIPVRLASGLPAILAGNGAAAPHLLYLPETVVPAVGELVVTSGADGKLPPGIPVGVIAEGAAEARQVPVRLLTDPARVQALRLIAPIPEEDTLPPALPPPASAP